MYPDLEYVLKKRYLVGIGVRIAALLLLLLGLLPLVRLVIEGVLLAPFFGYQQMGVRYFATWPELLAAYLPESGRYVIPAGLLLLLQGRLVRAIAPMPKPECPNCGYGTAQLTEPRCPECGQQLPAPTDEAEPDA